MAVRVNSREQNPQSPRNPTKDQEMGKHPNPKPQTTRTQDPTQVLVGEGKRGKQRSQDPQMGTSLAPPPHELVQEWSQSTADSVQGRCSRKKIDDETFRYPTSASTRERKKTLLTDNFSNCRVHRNDRIRKVRVKGMLDSLPEMTSQQSRQTESIQGLAVPQFWKCVNRRRRRPGAHTPGGGFDHRQR